ncbi:MAG: hypothetical protein ACOVQE_07010 [Chitinophagaceae bacterium]
MLANRRIIVSLLYLCCIFFSTTACKKGVDSTFTAYENHPMNDTVWLDKVLKPNYADAYFQEFSLPQFVINFNPSINNNISLGDSITINIPENACVDSAGQLVSGSVKLAVRHFFKKEQYVFGDKNTVSANGFVEPVSMLEFILTQNNRLLQLVNNKSIAVKIKHVALKPNHYSVYTLNPPSINAHMFNGIWQQLSATTVFLNTNVATGIVENYEFTVHKTGWYCIAKPSALNTETVPISVSLPINFTNKNTVVYLIGKNQPIIIPLTGSKEKKIFEFANVPVKTTFYVVSFSKFGNDFYVGFNSQSFSLADYQSSIYPQKISMQDLQILIKSLQ